MPLRQKYNIQARINEAKRKIRRDAKKHKLRKSRRPVPLEIPNSFPGKEEILREYIRDMARHQEEEQRKKKKKNNNDDDNNSDEEEQMAGATTAQGALNAALCEACAAGTTNPEDLLASVDIPASFPTGTRPTSAILFVLKGKEAPTDLSVPTLCIREGPEDGKDPLVLDAGASSTKEHLAHEAQLSRRCREFLREHADCSIKGARPCAYVLAPSLRTLQALVDAVARRRVPEVQQCASRGRSIAVDVGVGLLLCAVRR